MSARVMIVRHARKGDGKDAPKNHLSPQGEDESRELGKNLPKSMQGAPIDYVGGSVHSRSLHTALLIALGAGSDPLILPSTNYLGSEEQFWQMTTLDAYNAAITKHAGNIMLAVKEILSPRDCQKIRDNMVKAVLVAGNMGRRVILGTHNPWIQFFFENLTAGRYDLNALELSYIVVDVDGKTLSFIETNLYPM